MTEKCTTDVNGFNRCAARMFLLGRYCARKLVDPMNPEHLKAWEEKYSDRLESFEREKPGVVFDLFDAELRDAAARMIENFLYDEEVSHDGEVPSSGNRMVHPVPSILDRPPSGREEAS